jgi:hypothetical protein
MSRIKCHALVVSTSTPVGAVTNIKRTDGSNDKDMAFLVLGVDTITATPTGDKTPKEIRCKDPKINESLLTGATDLSTQTNMLHTNDIRNKTKISRDYDEFFDTLDTDTGNDDSNIEDTAGAASNAENDDSVSALSGDTAY